MRIASLLNVGSADLSAKKFNIFIGISLGNKYFTEQNIKEYLLWALEHTREQAAILIPDKIHAINYEVRNGYSKERAKNLALKEGEKAANICKNIVTQLVEEKRVRVDILKWEDIETPEHTVMAEVLHQEFRDNNQFRDLIIEIVKENVHSDLSNLEYEKLAAYPVEELPMLVSGIEYKGIRYDLLPYPGISKIDYLAIDLQEGKSFPDITKKLNIQAKLGLIEAYADSFSDYKNRKYTVVPYDPAWPQQFVRQADTLKSIFSDKVLSIEHIGSTAVPGLAGKPTIDILILVNDISVADELRTQMENAGYRALGEYVTEGSRLFVKESDNIRYVNIHVFQKDHLHVREMLRLRDYLRAHPKVVSEYSRLKIDLAAKYPNDYGEYRKHKDEWMNKLKILIQ